MLMKKPEVTEKEARIRHVVRLRHIPYGFFEKQINGYFSQFGVVKKVRVLRSKKGYHKGIAFVEFANEEVAQIAAQTMDNYLLAEKRLRCKVLSQEELPKCIQRGKLFVKVPKIGESRVKHAKKLFAHRTSEQEEHQRLKLLKNLRIKMAKIKAMGINYEFNFEKKFDLFLLKEREKRLKKEEAAEIENANLKKEEEHGSDEKEEKTDEKKKQTKIVKKKLKKAKGRS